MRERRRRHHLRSRRRAGASCRVSTTTSLSGLFALQARGRAAGEDDAVSCPLRFAHLSAKNAAAWVSFSRRST